jgi:hypothetical protein
MISRSAGINPAPFPSARRAPNLKVLDWWSGLQAHLHRSIMVDGAERRATTPDFPGGSTANRHVASSLPFGSNQL